MELKPFASREPDADFAQIDVDAVARRYKSFATVRHPYIRVLASFDQRTQTGSAHAEDIIREFPPPLAGFDQRTTSELLGKPGVDEQLPGYDRWWACPRCNYEPHPSTFPEYMIWLERNLKNGTLAWWHDPTITHFRPATMFTHWPDGKQAVTKILKIEDNLDAALASTLAEFGLGRRRRLQPLGRNAKSSKRGAFCGPDRCDACALLAETRHTPATIRIVDRLYARDFELLGYQKINARMMRLCGQRAARQAALASQQRRPVVRRKPKKYRGPTRTPPASKRNDKPQEEEFGRHMRKWLEGEQVPSMLIE